MKVFAEKRCLVGTIRRIDGLKTRELSALTGVDIRRLQAFEATAGRRPLRPEEVQSLADFFNVPARYIADLRGYAV